MTSNEFEAPLPAASEPSPAKDETINVVEEYSSHSFFPSSLLKDDGAGEEEGNTMNVPVLSPHQG